MQYSQSFAPPKPFDLCLLTPQLTINSCATCHCNKRVFKCPVIPMSIIISYGCTPITPYEIYHCLPWREWRHFFQDKTSTKSKLSLSSMIKNSWSARDQLRSYCILENKLLEGRQYMNLVNQNKYLPHCNLQHILTYLTYPPVGHLQAVILEMMWQEKSTVKLLFGSLQSCCSPWLIITDSWSLAILGFSLVKFRHKLNHPAVHV